MKEYPKDFPREVWFAFAQLAAVIAVMGVVYWFTRMTPEREAALKAEGAAAFDVKVDQAGGWSAWIAGEIVEVR